MPYASAVEDPGAQLEMNALYIDVFPTIRTPPEAFRNVFSKLNTLGNPPTENTCLMRGDTAGI